MTDFQIQAVHRNPLYVASQGVSILGGPLDSVSRSRASTAKKNDWLKQPLRGYSCFSELMLQAGEHNDAFYVIMYYCRRLLIW